MLTETHQAFQLALTAGAGDITTAGLIALKRRTAPGDSAAAPPAAVVATAVAVTSLTQMSWDTFSQLLAWAWERLGYDVEVTDVGGAGVVDFILTDSGGYTYVQARGWQRQQVSARDIERLHTDMALVGVERGIWMTCGRLTSEARVSAARHGIRVIGAEELAIMVDRLRSGQVSKTGRGAPRRGLS